MDRATVKEAMRRLSLFEGLGEGDLEQLVGMSRVLSLASGEVLMREGERGDTMYVIVDGELEVSKRQGGQEGVLAVRAAGDTVGEMALLEGGPRLATVRATRDTQVLVIDREALTTLLSCSPTAAPTILATFASRLRSTESMLMHQAKLAGLGTMAAGLAHELNNPAAAIRRSADHLRDALGRLDAATLALARRPLDEREALALESLREEAPERPSAAVARQHGLEAGVEGWLDRAGFDDAWSLAPALAAAGWTPGALGDRLERFGEAHRGTVVRWLAARAATDELLEEAHLSAEAISGIVAAVRRYSYLDQAPVQQVDVHEGLETTLVILGHKLRDGVEVVREYAADLPTIEAHGSELNQAWTNLVDNAVDAMGGRGTVTIRTAATPREIVVEIEDDGPGIPEDVQPRLFEPFFTTKDVGDGTGLGLHIAYTIVVHRHRGRIDVRSEPGATCFRVTLPRTLSDR